MNLGTLHLASHAYTRTLCDTGYAYFEHDDHLVRTPRRGSGRAQGYRGEAQWVDLPSGWADDADFLRPGGGTRPLTRRCELEILMIEKDSRGD